MDQFIEQASAQGCQTETLHFTIDEARAVQKLSASQLPDQALWIVKMVQAAVCGKAAGVDIRLGRKKIEIGFDSTQLPSALELLRIVKSGTLPKDPFLLHLCTGIRSSFADEGVSFLIQIAGPEGLEVVSLSEGQSYHRQDPALAEARKTLRFVITRPPRMLSLKKSMNLPVRYLVKGTASEHSELVSRCWTSPIPITIDGKRLDTRYDSPLMYSGTVSRLVEIQGRNLRQLVPRMNLYLRYLPVKEGRPGIPKSEFGREGSIRFQCEDGLALLMQKPVFLEGRFLEWDCDGKQAGAVLMAPSAVGHKRYLFFVHDGVVVQRAEILISQPKKKFLGLSFDQHNGGESFLLPVDFDDLDLSQFKVKEAEEMRRDILKEYLPRIYECDDVVQRLLSHLFYVPAPRRRSKIALALAGTATVPVAAGFGMVGVLAYVGYQVMFVGFMGGVTKQASSNLLRDNYAKSAARRAVFRIEDVEQPPLR